MHLPLFHQLLDHDPPEVLHIGNISEFPSISFLFLPSSFPRDTPTDLCSTCADEQDRRHLGAGQLACQSRYCGLPLIAFSCVEALRGGEGIRPSAVFDP